MKNNQPKQISVKLIEITNQLLVDLDISQNFREISLRESLQGHLGIDSIGRAELSSRVEKAFGIELPSNVIAEAETLADIEAAIAASPMTKEVENIFQTKLELPVDHCTIDPSLASSLQEVLMMHAAATPDRIHLCLIDETGKEEMITYQQLLTNALQIAANLKKRGLEKGDTVAIMLPTQASFFYCFLGILFAGGVPIPIYPPARAHQLEQYAKKEAAILSNASVRFLITFKQAKLLSQLLRPFVPSLKEIITSIDLMESTDTLKPVHGNSHDFVLIQYTSGSTSQPKGVLLTQQNILSNIRSYGKGIQITSKDVCVSWLPLYHDLGLIGNWLGSLYFGVRLVAFSPIIFLNHPEKWLWAIHHYRGTISAGPNFAYELCTRKIDPTHLEGLDLSSWRLAINGAEAIYPKTLERFSQKFSPYGFRTESFLPVYGLAENSLGLTAPPLGRKPVFDTINRDEFEKHHIAVPVSNSRFKNTLQFTSCGGPLPDNQIRIVDRNYQNVDERVIGHIQFQGPSSMQAYFNNPEATQKVYHDGWWDTGDLGYLANGEIYITGRQKDVIIKAGRNFFTSEIEDITSEVPGIRRGCVIAFSINDAENGTDQLIIVAETAIIKEEPLEKIRKQIQDCMISTLNVAADKIILVAPQRIPKTSSGKLQRSSCKTMYLENKLHKKNLKPWVQLIKISFSSLNRKSYRLIGSLIKMLYTAYIAILLCLTLPVLWLLTFITTSSAFSWLFSSWAKLICKLSLCPQKISGKKNLTQSKPVIYASNHASYSDVLLLSALLPPKTLFIGKKSLFEAPFLKTFLHKLKHISVDKEDMTQSLEDVKQVAIVLKNKGAVLVFPEGTFSYAPGLRPFKLSIFKIAAELNVPICPIAISGTRYLLRGNELILKPHPIKTHVGKLIYPSGSEWKDITELKNKVRADILAHCGESTLDFVIPTGSGKKESLE
ncbi:MAG: AMP-binding protein [Gammaproteobacteria bacterium]